MSNHAVKNRPRRNRTLKQSIRLVLILLLGATFPAVSAEAARFMTSGFRTLDTRPAKIAVLPPRADFIKKKILVSHELVEEAAALERAAATWIGKMLEDKGYEVEIITAEQLSADPRLGDLVRLIHQRYDEEWKRMMRKPKKVRTGRYNAGDDVRRAAALLGVDGLVLPRIQAVGATGGQKAMALMFGGVTGYARLDLAVADGETGTVEALFIGAVQAGFKSLTNQPDKMMMRVAKSTLKRYPSSAQALKAVYVAAAGDDADDDSDAAVLSDLEALLGPEEEEGDGDGDPEG